MIVLSDIHGNLPALEAVQDDADSVEDAFFCGDMVGYYPWPDAVIETARENGFRAVRGNHDEALVSDSTFGFNSVAAEALDWTRENISDPALEYLEGIPYSRRESMSGVEILMVHGSPQRPVSEYVYPGQVDEKFVERQDVDVDILLLGHTHVPFVNQVAGTLVVNPGSVGQPRDGDPRASYAEIDLQEQSAEVHRVEYDIDRVEEKVGEVDLPVTLAERLKRGQ
ncbi:MAG: metallophosphoesterase [Candidatus Nanohaloarchaea archaeon]